MKKIFIAFLALIIISALILFAFRDQLSLNTIINNIEKKNDLEIELKDKQIPYNKSVFPWSASGRAMTTDSIEGKTKILASEDNSRILGVGIVGNNAGELISEAVLAIEMGANIEDISLTIHPHPTLSETFANASEILNKTITDLYIK